MPTDNIREPNMTRDNQRCKYCRGGGGFHKMSCFVSKNPQLALAIDQKKGHKMDCSGNFKRTPTIKTPTILYVKDEKHHVISHTVIDYEQVDSILAEIADILSRNHWHHEIKIPPSTPYFLSEIFTEDGSL